MMCYIFTIYIILMNAMISTIFLTFVVDSTQEILSCNIFQNFLLIKESADVNSFHILTQMYFE